MLSYTGELCPYCQKPFAEDDDIAVCPVCGTPHHRACYHEHGDCANKELHNAAYDYTIDRAKRQEDQLILRGSRRCSACGHPLPTTGSFCNYCGKPFTNNNPDHSPPPGGGFKSTASRLLTRPQSDDDDSDTDRMSYRAQAEREADNRSALFRDAEKVQEVDGISIPDWQTYIGRNSDFYIRQFRLQQITGRNLSFMLSAMLFPGLYFLYRKVWLIAALALVTSFAINLPGSLLILSDSGYITLARADLWLAIYNYTRFLSFAGNVIWGLFSVRIYRYFAGRRLRALRSYAGNIDEFRKVLAKKAGPSLTALVIFTVAAVAAVMLFLPDAVNLFT